MNTQDINVPAAIHPTLYARMSMIGYRDLGLQARVKLVAHLGLSCKVGGKFLDTAKGEVSMIQQILKTFTYSVVDINLPGAQYPSQFPSPSRPLLARCLFSPHLHCHITSRGILSLLLLPMAVETVKKLYP